jgi:hypothetical protein
MTIRSHLGMMLFCLFTALSATLSATLSAMAEEPAVSIIPTSSVGAPLLVDENGSDALVGVVLATIPTGTVQVQMANPAPGEVSLSAVSLTFTAANWNQLQTVIISGLDDGLVDGDRAVTVAVTVSAPGTDYAGVDPPDIFLLNRDRQVPGLSVGESGGTTSLVEGGAGDDITVVLAARPASDVTMTVAGAGLTATPATLTFTTGNWDAPRSVVLVATNDARVTGTRTVSVVVSATGSGYVDTDATVSATIIEDDVAAIEMTPQAGLATNESGLQAQVRIRLASQPSANVTVPLSSSDAGEGTVAPASLVFTPQNWDVYQTAILTGVADQIVDGNQPWSLLTGPAASADGAYAGLTGPIAGVVNNDADVAALLVAPLMVVVNQGGGTATIQVSLVTRPVGDVTVDLVSNLPGEATVAPAQLVFTAGNGGTWATPQTITVTGQASGSADDQGFTITATPSGDAVYAALPATVVTGSNQDVSQPRVLLGATSAPTLAEAGGGTVTSVTYSVRLSTDPGEGVTITVMPTPLAGQLLVVTGASLSFNHDNYATPQTVTIAAVDDRVAEGLHEGRIEHAVTGAFATVVLTMPIVDDDAPAIATTPLAGLATTEVGGTASFTVRLASQPTDAVTVPLTVSDGDQATVAPASLTFQPAEWDLPKTVTLTGIDANSRDDGDVPYEVRLGPAVSNDPFYQGRVGSPVGAINQRVDHPPTIDILAPLALDEDAGLQAIALTGISSGQTGEDQALTVLAVSSDPALTGPLTVHYTSPDATGAVRFTPAANRSGTATITVTVGDGVTTTVRTCAVTVRPVNDLPVLVRTTALVVGYRGSGAWRGLDADPVAPGQLAADDVETPAAQLVFHLVLVPTGGRLERDGVHLENDGTFTQADVDAGRIAYTHRGTAGTSDGFVVRIGDEDGGLSDSLIIPITIDSRAPAVDLLPDEDATWSEGDTPVLLAPAALVADLDSSNFGGGSCTLTVATGGRADDLLAFVSSGSGAGQIQVADGTVYFGGVDIGTVTGGAWPTPLAVAFNAAATPTAAQALLRQATWTSSSDDPGSTTRIVHAVLVDELGFASPPQPRRVLTTPVNDAPTVRSVAVVTVADVAVPGTLLASDPDGSATVWSLVTEPTRGRLTAFDGTAGTFTYEPYPGQVGIDTFTVRAGDGLAWSAPGTVTVHVTGDGTVVRPWLIADAPLVLQAGDVLAWTVRVDVTELTAPSLVFQLEDAPVGMSITPDPSAGTALVGWPVAAGSGHVRFRVRVWDGISHSGDVQSVVIYVRPMPGGGG